MLLWVCSACVQWEIEARIYVAFYTELEGILFQFSTLWHFPIVSSPQGPSLSWFFWPGSYGSLKSFSFLHFVLFCVTGAALGIKQGEKRKKKM
jgi:hypothetical protein